MLGTVLLYILALLVPSLITYRLLLHPFSKYPGPFLAKLTNGYAGFMAARRRLHLIAYETHKKDGPVVRLAPNRILFNSGTAFRAIYQDDTRITKANVYELFTRNGVYSVFNTLDRQSHRAKRKIVAQAFSERAMRSFTPALLPHINICLRQFFEASSSGQPVNMTKQMSNLAVDVVGELALGYDLNTQTSEGNRFFAKALTVGFFVSNISLHFPPFQKVHGNRVFDYLLWETRERFSRLLEKMVTTRLALDTHAVPDFFSFVAEGLPNNATKTRDSAVWKEGLVFLAAGGDTVATAMTALFFYLSRYPACYTRLAREIRSTFAKGEDITPGPQLAACHYLRACIDESLRMSPPISANLWRKQVEEDSEPLFIDGHFIPRGTYFGVNVYALSHNEEVFPDSFTFKPERWLEAEENPAGAKDNARLPMLETFASFSIGPRNCVGKPFAYLEISTMLAKTLWYFDFEPTSDPLGTIGEATARGRPREFCTHDGFNSSHDGPFLNFTPREGTLLE
ncbi:cytochrome P450 [Astrocystis sublimbata]|nr:cytochrome P450 [Astrocystis sublimbata]